MRKSLVLLLSCCSPLALAQQLAIPQAYQWSTALTLETIDNLQGGVAEGAKGLANLDVTLTVDTGAADWWDNGTWFVYVLGNYGSNPSAMSGDMQTLSNIATDDALKIYEFWYQHHFADDKIQLLLGLHDYNSVFYSLDSAGLFTSASFGIGPDTSQVSPSIFSTTSAAVQLSLTQDSFYMLLAAYDGVPGDPDNSRGTHIQFNKGDGVFRAAEVGVIEDQQYKFGVGAWQKTTREDSAVDGQPSNKNSGYYIIGEKNLSEQWTVFFQYGRADEDKNQLDEYWGGGVTLSGYWQEGDDAGLGCSRAHNGLPFLQQPENANLEKAETLCELTYFRPLVEHLNGQASLYYVENPSMQPELDNALALGVRLYIEF